MNVSLHPVIMWDANKGVKSYCARLKLQVNHVSKAELDIAMKIYHTYFIIVRIPTWYILNTIK
jgi:hypothetical protein